MDKKEFTEQLQAMHDRVLSKAMSKEEENSYTESLFESIRHVNEYGQEFWTKPKPLVKTVETIFLTIFPTWEKSLKPALHIKTLVIFSFPVMHAT